MIVQTQAEAFWRLSSYRLLTVFCLQSIQTRRTRLDDFDTLHCRADLLRPGIEALALFTTEASIAVNEDALPAEL